MGFNSGFKGLNNVSFVTIIGFAIPDGSFVTVTFRPPPTLGVGRQCYDTNSCQFLYRAPRCVTELKNNHKYVCFQSNTTMFYYLTYWRQVSVLKPSSGHLYIKFKQLYVIFQYSSIYIIPIRCTRHSLFYLTTALYVSGVTITHLQEHKTTLTTALGNRYTVTDKFLLLKSTYRLD